MSSNNFKDRLYKLVLNIISLLDSLNKEMVSYRISDQLLRSSTSVLANFTEGQSAASKKDLINFYVISLKSANESKLWMNLLADTKRTNREKVQPLINEMDEIAKIIAASIITLKKGIEK